MRMRHVDGITHILDVLQALLTAYVLGPGCLLLLFAVGVSLFV